MYKQNFGLNFLIFLSGALRISYATKYNIYCTDIFKTSAAFETWILEELRYTRAEQIPPNRLNSRNFRSAIRHKVAQRRALKLHSGVH